MDSANSDLRQLLPQLTADAARELGHEEDATGDEHKRRARALFAYADALDGGPEPLAPATEPTQPRTAGPVIPPPEPEEPRRAAPAAPPSDKKPLISEVVRERPLPGWSPEQVHHVLVQREMIPPETTKASIGVTMRRMYTKYEHLAKTPDGLYTTPENGVMHRDEAQPPPQDNPFADAPNGPAPGPALSFRGAQPATDPRAVTR
ncbi:hypothetical protein [Baekduia sp. Peel2402]|uniref:hypothetical protein n=1 Tax=Baekduia sp. Peel2402 TaxID=3458296 RepID=UPI00403E37CD